MVAITFASMTPVTAANRTAIQSPSAVVRTSFAELADFDLVVDAVHGGNEGNGHEADDDTHEDDDGRLEERGCALQFRLQFSAVIGGSDFQLLVERSRLLADAEHLARGRREQSTLGDWLSESLALHHGLTDLLQGIAVNRIVCRLSRDGHRTGQVDAGTEH